ncbi:zinc ribbon domain-containing protein [Novilysobacter erysipheiresistens]|uniref:Zinc ribbon domain-containing protein n=1 Tax=Novilysobacter erysipheiresistens TaxID=1749332 RepID=A0ABU7YUR7_9GAMM
MTDYACAKCGETEYLRREIRTEGGFLSAAFDVSNNRFTAVSCKRCGYTELYRTDVAGGAQLFDFLAG